MAAKKKADSSDDPPVRVELESGWQRAKTEASALADGRLGSLLWLDARCQRAGMHPLDPWWVDHFAAYYASKKLIDVCRKGLRAGGSASACRALTRAALFTERDLDPGTIGVIPIMSSSRDEATDRFFTIQRILRACGVAPERGDEDDAREVLPHGLGTKYKTTKSQAGGGMIQTEDISGHVIEFRVLPAMRRAAVGYTGISGFLDESDLWLNDPDLHANPASVIFDEIIKRFTTQVLAELFIFSASYHASSAHSARVDMGDSASQYVARLGMEGARLDDESRARLADQIGVADPRLVATADPMSVDVPAWVSASPVSPIERCWMLSEGPGITIEQQIGRMLGKYGGRATENAKGAEGGETLAGVTRRRASRLSRIDAGAWATPRDAVIGIAPSIDGSEWGIVVLGEGLVLEDASARFSGGEAAAEVCDLAVRWGATFGAVEGCHLGRVKQELDAYVSGTGRSAPALARCALYDGGALCVGPLRTLYEHGRIGHVDGLEDLEREEEAWRPELGRSARLEALSAAAAYLRDTGRLRLDGAGCDPGGAPQTVGAMLDRGSMRTDMRETFDPALFRRSREDWI